ncbi:MAG TPA: hypothetical protein PK675_04405 [Clostridia bacterium]|nr:hypothetical protein [Clostridia bacterium]
MKSYLIPIKNDLYDISHRLMEIDSCYRVFYNAKKDRYEIHREKYGKTEFSFVVPYENLDARTVDYALQTRTENIDKLTAEIEAHNRYIEKSASNTYKEKITKIMEVKN